MIAYKLTDKDGYTRRKFSGETLWRVGETVMPTGVGTLPCGPGVLHAYCAPEVALLGNPIHAEFGLGMRLFRLSTDGEWQTDGLKRWTTAPVRVEEELSIPVLTLEERVAWAICLVPHSITRQWAIGWLSGQDRTSVGAMQAAMERPWSAVAAAAVVAAAAWPTPAEMEASWWTAKAAEGAAVAESVVTKAESRLMPMLYRAREILAGRMPAERYDEESA